MLTNNEKSTLINMVLGLDTSKLSTSRILCEFDNIRKEGLAPSISKIYKDKNINIKILWQEESIKLLHSEITTNFILAELKSKSIDYFPLKGLAYKDIFAFENYVRPSFDIDLLIDISLYKKVDFVLMDLLKLYPKFGRQSLYTQNQLTYIGEYANTKHYLDLHILPFKDDKLSELSLIIKRDISDLTFLYFFSMMHFLWEVNNKNQARLNWYVDLIILTELLNPIEEIKFYDFLEDNLLLSLFISGLEKVTEFHNNSKIRKIILRYSWLTTSIPKEYKYLVKKYPIWKVQLRYFLNKKGLVRKIQFLFYAIFPDKSFIRMKYNKKEGDNVLLDYLRRIFNVKFK